MLCGVLLAFGLIGGQLVRLALKAAAEIKVTLAEPLARSWSRPDIVDRHGRLLATDVGMHSLYADPHLVQDVDEATEKLAAALPGLDAAELRKALADRSRRFAWVARGLSPRQAQRVHALGLPGLAFRTELKRVYPLGRSGRAHAGHRQHRQQGHRRHRAHARRGRPRGGRAGPPPHVRPRQCGCRSTSACSTRLRRS